MKTFIKLLKTELKLNVRDMNMVLFAICMPVVVLVILGFIYQTKPAFEGANYTFLEQSMSAVCTISICAGGLMGLPMVVSGYRERKILKRFRVTPISPVILLFVEVTIYILYSAASMLLVFPVAALFCGVRLHGNWMAFMGSWFLTLISTLSIGMMVGGIAKNEKMAGVIASALYFPMLIFSGATLPFEIMPDIMQKIVLLFPLTQGIQLMKATFLGLPVNNLWLSVAVMGAVTIICTCTAVKCFKWE